MMCAQRSLLILFIVISRPATTRTIFNLELVVIPNPSRIIWLPWFLKFWLTVLRRMLPLAWRTYKKMRRKSTMTSRNWMRVLSTMPTGIGSGKEKLEIETMHLRNELRSHLLQPPQPGQAVTPSGEECRRSSVREHANETATPNLYSASTPAATSTQNGKTFTGTSTVMQKHRLAGGEATSTESGSSPSRSTVRPPKKAYIIEQHLARLLQAQADLIFCLKAHDEDEVALDAEALVSNTCPPLLPFFSLSFTHRLDGGR